MTGPCSPVRRNRLLLAGFGFTVLIGGIGCGESDGREPAATPTPVRTPAMTATSVPTETSSATPVATPTLTPAASPTQTSNFRPVVVAILEDIADEICRTDSTPGGGVTVAAENGVGVLNCTSFTGHRGTVELRISDDRESAQDVFETLAPNVPSVAFNDGMLRRQCAPSDCRVAAQLSQQWGWVKDCWVVQGNSFDDTQFLLSPQPHETIEAIAGTSSFSAVRCPSACGDAEVKGRFRTCQVADTEVECVDAGGRWGRYPFSGRPGCFCSTGQAGCSCVRGSDCLGQCYAPRGGPDYCSGVVQGQCSAEEPEGGCWCVFDESGEASGQCADP